MSVIWFTGLSGAGKTTLALALTKVLKEQGLAVEHLDGDVIRKLFPNIGFSREERTNHLAKIGLMASQIEKNGVFVVASFISPYENSRQHIRALCNDFVEVYLSTSLEVCESRDPKGLYARVRRGEIASFTGIDEPYEIPSNPEIIIDTSKISPEDAVKLILEGMAARGLKNKTLNQRHLPKGETTKSPGL